MAPQSSRATIASSERPIQQGTQRGAALLEFVIVFPVLVMLLFGTWEFGRIFDAWLVSTNAAREGARYGVEWNATKDGPLIPFVQGKVLDYVNSGYGARVNTPGGDVRIDPADITVTPGSGQVTVAVTAHVDIWAPAVAPLMGGSTFSVGAWTTMRQ